VDTVQVVHDLGQVKATDGLGENFEASDSYAIGWEAGIRTPILVREL
jgi:hypothetical protein